MRRADSITILPNTGKVVVVAIGSSSTEGAFASSPAAYYPSVLQRLLSLRPEIAAFEVFNKGAGGESLSQMQARLQRDVLDLNPQVVILQTGTIEAISAQNSAAIDDFRARLRAVVSGLKSRTAVVLMNSQHYPSQPANYTAYQAVLDDVSAEQKVALIDRYALMKSWIDSNAFSFSQILASDLFHPNDFTYRCTAQIAADLLLSKTVKPAGA